jgi:hypothetical protein
VNKNKQRKKTAKIFSFLTSGRENGKFCHQEEEEQQLTAY